MPSGARVHRSLGSASDGSTRVKTMFAGSVTYGTTTVTIRCPRRTSPPGDVGSGSTLATIDTENDPVFEKNAVG